MSNRRIISSMRQDSAAISGEGRTIISRHRTLAALLPLILVLLIWVIVAVQTAFIFGGPSGRGFGSDFAIMYAGSRLLERGQNPYDHRLAFAEQRQALRAQGLKASTDRSLIRVGNPPLMLWAIEPLARMGFLAAGWTWLVIQVVCTLLGFFACVLALGWRKWVPPLLVFLALPQVMLQHFYGNVTSVVFAGFSWAYLLASRRPFLAG